MFNAALPVSPFPVCQVGGGGGRAVALTHIPHLLPADPDSNDPGAAEVLLEHTGGACQAGAAVACMSREACYSCVAHVAALQCTWQRALCAWQGSYRIGPACADVPFTCCPPPLLDWPAADMFFAQRDKPAAFAAARQHLTPHAAAVLQVLWACFGWALCWGGRGGLTPLGESGRGRVH